MTSRKIVAVKMMKQNTLVPYKSSSSDEETIEQKTVKGPAVMKNGVQKVVSSEDRTSSKSFLMWENNNNVCWLDASMALIVHNQTLIKSLSEDSSSQITKIVESYYEAVSIINNCSDERHIEVRVKVAKDLLKNVQDTVLKYLQPILKYKEGEPDSAFCALFNLISEDKSTKAYFEVEFTWLQSCKECPSHRAIKHKKPIVTLPKVIHFQAQCPVVIYQCPKCKEPNQKMTLSFRTLPQCLLFHFESGAGVGELKFNDFEVDGRTYRLTGVMTLEKGKESLVNHFITFVRDADSDTWLECNDLNDEIMCFCMVPPILELEDIYLLMYEANDNRGTIANRSLSLNKRGLGEESVSSSAEIPFIDLADDTEKETTSDKDRRCNQPREVTKRCRNTAGLLEPSEDDLNNEPSNLDSLLQSDSGDVSEGKPECGVFNAEMAALSLQERATANPSSKTVTNGTGVLSEINTSENFVTLDTTSKDPGLAQVNSPSYSNPVYFQSESITFAENTGKPSEIFINGNCESTVNKTQNSVSPDTSNVPVDKKRKSMSSEVNDKTVSSVDADKSMSLYEEESSHKFSAVESVDPCKVVKKKAKVKRKRTNSLKPKRRRTKSYELSDNVMEHSEIVVEHSKKDYSEFLKTVEKFTKKSGSLNLNRHRAEPSELSSDLMKHSENAKIPKKLNHKRNLELVGPKSVIEENNKNILHVLREQKSDVDHNTFLAACDNSMEHYKNTKILQGTSRLEADGPNKQTFTNAGVKLKENSCAEQIPSSCDNSTEDLKNNVNMKACSCDCIPQGMDALIDIEVDNALISIFRGLDMRKRT